MRIQRVATGLLDFLNLRSQGETPDELSRVVRGSLDLQPFYELSKHESALEPVNMVSGQIEFIEVPSDETWLLLSVSCIADPPGVATQGIRQYAFTYSLERLVGAGLNGVPFHTSPILTFPESTAATSMRLCYAKLLERPFLVRAGQRITVQLQYGATISGAAAAWVGDFELHIVRLRT